MGSLHAEPSIQPARARATIRLWHSVIYHHLFLLIAISFDAGQIAGQATSRPPIGAVDFGQLPQTNNNSADISHLSDINMAGAKPASLPTAIGLSQHQPQSQQTKSLKFTLIAGKFWKFNIKANSFTSHKEEELRLHKNLSINNYIIDDDGWFQYNPQQQQLFAWPDLTVKQGTYHFVLLPSGEDFEAGSENSVPPDVVANIIVELIKPLNYGPKSDIDQLIDHKFSLDHLHRLSSYPLLLQQIVAVFDTFSRNTNHSLGQSSNKSSTSLAATLLSQAKNLRPSNKLSEYLLISSSYSSDGDLFSLTWSTHPAIINNTITMISDCRVPVINEIVSRLANVNTGYSTGDDKFNIYYPLEGAQMNSQAILPTDRGNYALKLKLNSPCQREKVIEQLLPQYPNRYNSLVLADFDDKENSIVEQQRQSSIGPTSSTIAPDKVTSAEQPQSSTILADPVIHKISYTTTSAPSFAVEGTTALPVVQVSRTVVATPTPLLHTYSAPAHVETSTEIHSTNGLLSLAASTEGTSVLPPSQHPTVNSVVKETTTTSEIPRETITTPSNLLKERKEYIWNQKQVNKLDGQITIPSPRIPPQAKSFEKFFDSPDDRIPSSAMNNMISTTTVASTSSNTSTNGFSQKAAAPIPITRDMVQDSSLNEDFMAIVTDVVDYLVSIAVPLSIFLGITLLISIIIACCNLCAKRRKSKQFQVKDRYSFRYSSERSAFLKNSSKPVILDVDQKSISMGGTPQHHSLRSNDKNGTDMTQYLPLHQLSLAPQ